MIFLWVELIYFEIERIFLNIFRTDEIDGLKTINPSISSVLCPLIVSLVSLFGIKNEPDILNTINSQPIIEYLSHLIEGLLSLYFIWETNRNIALLKKKKQHNPIKFPQLDNTEFTTNWWNYL